MCCKPCRCRALKRYLGELELMTRICNFQCSMADFEAKLCVIKLRHLRYQWIPCEKFCSSMMLKTTIVIYDNFTTLKKICIEFHFT